MVLPLSSTFSEQVMWSSTSLRKMMLLSILLSRSQPIVSKSLSHHPVTHFHTVTPDILSDSPMTIPCFLWLTATLSQEVSSPLENMRFLLLLTLVALMHSAIVLFTLHIKFLLVFLVLLLKHETS